MIESILFIDLKYNVMSRDLDLKLLWWQGEK